MRFLRPTPSGPRPAAEDAIDKHITVLVADWNEPERKAMAGYLAEYECHVAEASDSSDTVSLVMRDPGQVVVMAEEMPPLDFVDLLPLVRRLTRSPIIVVGAGGQSAVLHALLQGADAYMTRPVSRQELLARIRRLLRASNGHGPKATMAMTLHLARAWAARFS